VFRWVRKARNWWERRERAQALRKVFDGRGRKEQGEGIAVAIDTDAYKVAFKQLPKQREGGGNQFVVSHC
jgi:hypothetical protein